MNQEQREVEFARAQETARRQLGFVLANLESLHRADRTRTLERAARSFHQCRDSFTPGQLAYIDGIYEKTMKGLGLPAAPVHHDKKPRGLRYG